MIVSKAVEKTRPAAIRDDVPLRGAGHRRWMGAVKMEHAGERVSPLEELAERRDELAYDLATELAVGGVLRDIGFEIDNELADENHGAVSEAVGQIVGHLRSLLEDSVRELALVASVEISGQPSADGGCGYVVIPIPPYPDVVDPASVTMRDPDEDEDDYDVQTEYDDELAEAHRSLVFDRSWHVRHLVGHAAELADAIVDSAHAGDEVSAVKYLRQRDAVVDILKEAFNLWEYALAGQMSGPAGPSDEIAAFTRWLDDATRPQ